MERISNPRLWKLKEQSRCSRERQVILLAIITTQNARFTLNQSTSFQNTTMISLPVHPPTPLPQPQSKQPTLPKINTYEVVSSAVPTANAPPNQQTPTLQW
ncbi:hypothetical protein TNCT_226051 [Trichonephila clavata]|uniref:Uncharacterized protein n=1 Tax=Trichonephila clavata TaxID=2740835 RepID=A0A8X6HPK7_TRICU|nr:hypothetical protein TNCT_226051 [Trichonephila clavata]